jgi:DNA-binding CsgD family transcriptional regulator/tetratricopeptide (TPR) repeat protein
MTTVAALDLGRAAYADRQWHNAFEHLMAADKEGGLPAQDLEQLATVAMMVGRDTDGVDLLSRAHEEYLGVGDIPGAARCAGWLGMQLMDMGERARSAGWFGRGQRLLQEAAEPCSVEGLLLLPVALGALFAGDGETALRTFDEVAAIGERFGDLDLCALGRLGQGQSRITLGQTSEGLAMLDEAMVAVTAGEVSPIPSGIIYCSVIDGCYLAFDIRRAQEWTAALDHWCQAQPGLVSFSGQCQAHRAELLILHGAWSEALEGLRTAQQRYRLGDRDAVWGAWYHQGEVQRLRGELGPAEKAYVTAHQSGFDPQPGLSLLRLAQGKPQAAQTAIRMAMDSADPSTRRRMLPARVEIELAAGDVDAALEAAAELAQYCRDNPMPMLQAAAAYANGSVLLHEGDARGALTALRRAWSLWYELDVPFEAARCRVLIGRAYRAMGDDDSAAMELAAARAAFSDLGSTPAVAYVDSLAPNAVRDPGHPLTRREVEVLRVVASGATNRSVASSLFLSEKTVARHVSNIFTKLGISSRAGATAWAYEHGLV